MYRTTTCSEFVYKIVVGACKSRLEQTFLRVLIIVCVLTFYRQGISIPHEGKVFEMSANTSRNLPSRLAGAAATRSGSLRRRTENETIDFSDDDMPMRQLPSVAPRREGLSRIKTRLADAAARSQTPKKKVASPSLEQVTSIKAKSGVFIAPAESPAFTPYSVSAPGTPKVSAAILSRQRVLEDQHHASKSKVDGSVSGGGVSLWPLMSDMRLSRHDTVFLVIINAILFPLTVAAFYLLHDGIADDLTDFTSQLRHFNQHHLIPVQGSDQLFRRALLKWHGDFDNLTFSIEHQYTTTFSHMDKAQQLLIIAYTLGLLVLVYYLFENVMSPSRLTPKRIKQWITLLSIVLVWTCFLLKLLLLAISLEISAKHVVLQLSKQLPLQIASQHDVAPLTALVQYWQLRMLPPTGPGLLSLWGSVRVPDIVQYLQYYSWPFVAAIVTPIFKLIWSLKTVYGIA